jgi:hypothetical protein
LNGERDYRRLILVRDEVDVPDTEDCERIRLRHYVERGEGLAVLPPINN